MSVECRSLRQVTKKSYVQKSEGHLQTISNVCRTLSLLLHDVRSHVMSSHKYTFFQILLKTSVAGGGLLITPANTKPTTTFIITD